MRALKTLAVVATLAAFGCGGGDDDGNPTGPPGGGATNGSLTAQINGTAWSAVGTITVSRQTNFILITGAIYAGSNTSSLVVGIANATGPGSHNLSLLSGDGSSLVVATTTTGYGTAFTGGSGTIPITSLTANRIVGTFSGVLPVSSGSATSLTITGGAFDVTF